MLVAMTFAVWFWGPQSGLDLSLFVPTLGHLDAAVGPGEAPVGQEGRVEHSEETEPPEKAIK